jgi:hypothetical protein
MTKLSNATVAADAPWGTIIGTFDADLKQLQINPFGYFGILEKRKLCTAWNGQAIPGQYDIGVHGSGKPEQFTITVAAVVATTPPPPPSHVVVIGMTEDAYQGDAEYSVAVDGAQAAAGKITTLQSSGKSQDISVTVPDGTHAITVTLMNDAWGGTPETDLNLHVNYIKYDADTVWSVPTTLWTIGDKLSVTVPAPPVQPTVITLTPVALSIQDNAPAGTVIAIASVVMSDGSQFTGTLTSSDPFFAISGMKIVTARALTAADDGKHTTTITAQQGSQIISARLSA